MNFSYELMTVIPVSNILGEGVLWRPTDQTLWWTDIAGKTLYKLHWGQSRPHEYALPLRLCSFGFIANDESVLIVAFENGLAYFWPANGDIQWLCKPKELTLGGGRRLNDGRVGPDGAFWVGSMLERENVSGGKGLTGLYRFTNDHHAELIHTGLHISNGITWSPEGAQIYLSDSHKNVVYRADFDVQTGMCGVFNTYATIYDGAPDGAITDSGGNYWSALWGGHCVVCYDSRGVEQARLEMTVPQPTIAGFGGPNLNHLIVASAFDGLGSEGRSRFPDSGHLFIYSTNIQGVEPNYFNKIQ